VRTSEYSFSSCHENFAAGEGIMMDLKGTFAGLAKFVVWAGLALALSVDWAAASPTRVTSKVNLRLGPGTNYGVLASIPGGSTVDVENCAGEWCTVHWRGRTGYAIARNLGFGGPGPAGGPYPPGPAVVGPPPMVVGVPPYVGPGYYGPYWGPGYGFWGPRWGYGWRRW
jgi:uncharacterized protein YraI